MVSNASCTTNCLAPLAKASGTSMLLVVVRSFTRSGGLVSRRYLSSSVITCLCLRRKKERERERNIYLYDDPNVFCLFAHETCVLEQDLGSGNQRQLWYCRGQLLQCGKHSDLLRVVDLWMFQAGNIWVCRIPTSAIPYRQGLMTTVHAMTATQLTVDGPSRGGKDRGFLKIPWLLSWQCTEKGMFMEKGPMLYQKECGWPLRNELGMKIVQYIIWSEVFESVVLFLHGLIFQRRNCDCSARIGAVDAVHRRTSSHLPPELPRRLAR